MATVVFMSVPAHGHINPTLPVVAELVRRGERVIYYASEEFRESITATGAEFRPYGILPEYDPAAVVGNVFRLFRFLLEGSRLVLDAHLEDIRALAPDYIMHDLMGVWGRMIAYLLEIPAIASVPIFALNEAASGLSPRFLAQNAWMFLRGIRHVWQFQQVSRALSRDYGLPRFTLSDMHTSQAPLSLVYTARAFQPRGDLYDDSFKFVGPAIAARAEPADFPFDRLDETCPLIYISLGTVMNQRADFYRQCFAAFGGEQYQVVLSVGQQTDIATLGTIPANFIVRNRVPQLDLLPCVDLFITHGGMNSVHEGLYFGVPLVVVPQTPEQGLVGEQVVRVGAGVLLAVNRLQVATLRAAADRVLADPAFRQSSERMSEAFKAAGGYQRAADAVLAFTAAQGIRR